MNDQFGRGFRTAIAILMSPIWLPLWFVFMMLLSLAKIVACGPKDYIKRGVAP